MASFLLHHSLLSLLLFSCIPFINSLSTVAISVSANRTTICGLIPRPSNPKQSFLNCSSFSNDSTQLPFITSNATYSGIVATESSVCALGSFSLPYNSTIVCWRFSNNNHSSGSSVHRIYQGETLVELEACGSSICGVSNATNRVQCWPQSSFNTTGSAQTCSSIAVGENFVCCLTDSGEILCPWGDMNLIHQVSEGNYRVISAGSTYACALNYSGNIICWGAMAAEMNRNPEGKFKSVAVGENRACALRNENDTVVCWGQNNFSLPEELLQTQFITIEANKNVFCGISSVNYSLYCWGSENLGSYLLVFEEVLPGPCRNSCPCGPLQGSALKGSGKYCETGYICDSFSISTNTSFVPPTSSLPQREPRSRGWSSRIISFFVVGCVGTSALLRIAAFFICKYCKCRAYRVHDSGPLDEAASSLEQGRPSLRQHSSQGRPMPVLEKRLSQLASLGNAGHLKEFSLQVVMEVTDNFSENRIIGTGSFGTVYYGVLEDGRSVAIKRAEKSSCSSSAVESRRQEDKDNAFIHELESLSRLHHKNLVGLLGFCEENGELVLVYEYMENGTLHDHLHKLQTSPLMSWPARIKIALDAARGIEYLHEYATPTIIHRDIKSSNILLDTTWTAKVSDFGLSLMGPDDDVPHLSLRVAGTVGYMDPEYYRLQQLTKKSDVYSFGVVLLEILSGYKAIHKNENGVPRNVVDFVVPYIVQDEIHRVVDPRLAAPTPYEIEAVAYVGYLAADCVTLEGRERPSMTEIVNSLDRALAACLLQPKSLSRSTTASST